MIDQYLLVVAPVAQAVKHVTASAIQSVGHDSVTMFRKLGRARVTFVVAIVVLEVLEPISGC